MTAPATEIESPRAVLVQPAPAQPVALTSDMSRDAWAAYHAGIWDARLSAHLHARYFASMRRLLGGCSALLQTIVFFGSIGAAVTLIAEIDRIAPLVVSTLVGLSAGVLTITKLPAKVQKAASLEEAWSVRKSFWDDAWIQVQDSHYLGSIATLRAPEAALARLEADLGIWEWSWYTKRVMRTVERTDTYAKARFA